jgi:hypothetical protein
MNKISIIQMRERKREREREREKASTRVERRRVG